MEYQTTIEINNSIKQIALKPALYKDVALWEITLDGRNHIVKKGENGWEDVTGDVSNNETLYKIGQAIDYLQIKHAG